MILGLPPESLGIDGVEFYGALGFMKAGLYYADAITTVSPGYAAEILTPAFGCGFDGLLRTRAGVLHGILNGLDETVWDPWTDFHLPARFRKGHLRNRVRCKGALQGGIGLAAAPDAPVFGIVSRLTGQKGMDLVLSVLPALLDGGAQLPCWVAGNPAWRTRSAMRPRPTPGLSPQSSAMTRHCRTDDRRRRRASGAEPVRTVRLTQMMAMRYGALRWSPGSAAWPTR